VPRNETTPRTAQTARRREFGQFPLTRPLAFTLRVKDTDMKDKAGQRKAEKKKTSVVRLDDLAPRQDVVGGAGKLVFGEGVVGDRGARDRAPRAERSRGREPKTRE
jgi:hypothetical protein